MKLTLFALIALALASCTSTKTLRPLPPLAKKTLPSDSAAHVEEKPELATKEVAAAPVTIARGNMFNDALMREIESEQFNTATLVERGKQKLEFDSVPRWRVQLTAVSDRDRAAQIQREFAQKETVETFVVEANNLFKVQAGNFTIRAHADQLLHDLKNRGVNGAWVVRAFELKRKEKASAAPPKEIPRKKAYRVQLGTFSTQANANRFKNTLNQTAENVVIIKKDDAFKVCAGEFESAEKAREHKQKLQDSGLQGFVVFL